MNKNSNEEGPKKKIKKLLTLTGCTKIIPPYYTSLKTKDQRKTILKLYNFYVRERNKVYPKKYIDTIFKLLYNNNGEKEIINIRNKINYKNIKYFSLNECLNKKNLPQVMNNTKKQSRNKLLLNTKSISSFSEKVIHPRICSAIEKNNNKIKLHNIHLHQNTIKKCFSQSDINQKIDDNVLKKNNENKIKIRKIFFKNSRILSCKDIIDKPVPNSTKLDKIPVLKNSNSNKTLSTYSTKPFQLYKNLISQTNKNNENFFLFSTHKRAFDSFINDNIILGKTNDKNRIPRLLFGSAVYMKKQRELYYSQEMRRLHNLSILNQKTTKARFYPKII